MNFCPDIVQLPINIMNQDILQTGTLARLKEKSVEVHARSIFLQGILLCPPKELPEQFGFLEKDLEEIHAAARKQKRDMVHFSLDMISQTGLIDVVIVGVSSETELMQILSYDANCGVNVEWNRFALASSDVIDPRNWK